MQQAFQVEIGAFADQFEIESEGLRDGLSPFEFEYLQVMLEGVEGQLERKIGGSKPSQLRRRLPK